jgi:rare lipoprotein A
MGAINFRRAFFLCLAFLVAGCVPSPRFTGTSAPPAEPSVTDYREEGMASYYADDFNGKQTSSGEVYDMNAMTAAHRTLPFGSIVRVTNLETGKSVVVRINDRGPFKDNRVIDLSLQAAKELECIGHGTVRVRLEVLKVLSPKAPDNE